MADRTLTWDTVYLLGWYENGRSYLTTWFESDLEMVRVVLFGSSTPPMWLAEVPRGMTLEEIPEAEPEPEAYAERRGGRYAFGWYVPDGITRGSPDKDEQRENNPH